tara:strand:+ start:695 stop:1099 length:405 start_codon:yes stop_codon:yes gene_type:complete
MKNLPLILSSLIVGIILFQSALIAPSINKLIDTADASILLRFIWPKFFLIIAIISLASFVICLIYSSLDFFKYLSFASFLLMLTCYLITPTINEAKDSLNEQLWTVLHLSTIVITLATLILNILMIVNWKSTDK